MENGFSGKEFQLTVKLRPLTRKIFSAKILPSNHFLSRAKRERERERTHMRKQRERERYREPRKVEIVAPLTRSSNPQIASRMNPRTHEQQTHDPRTANRRTHNWTANPRTASCTAQIAPASRTVIDLAIVLVTGELHCYRSRSCDFDFLLSLFDL